MIIEHDASSDVVRNHVEALLNQDLVSSVQLGIARAEDGCYVAQLVQVSTTPTRLRAVSLGRLVDVPPGQRRATWLLTDAVQEALCNPEAHQLLHW